MKKSIVKLAVIAATLFGLSYCSNVKKANVVEEYSAAIDSVACAVEDCGFDCDEDACYAVMSSNAR